MNDCMTQRVSNLECMFEFWDDPFKLDELTDELEAIATALQPSVSFRSSLTIVKVFTILYIAKQIS